ncbi:unnamed protein product [Pelagomonas calceolata]|uniref:MalT-like TPR region domain-containing protein n=1 Tax=Pelagomonas calceolata TaxID=35677 RepID=A0A8J2S6U8_9STRA|nr:unnamed protein product [Pelagomonas calceolata]
MTRATRAAVLALIATTVGAWPALDEKLQSYPSIHARETAKIKAGDAKGARYILVNAFQAELSMLQRLGAPAKDFLTAQTNLAISYGDLGNLEKARSMEQGVYSGRLKLHGEEHPETIKAANNYASSLVQLDRFEEAKSLLCKVMPVARRVLGENDDLTLRMKKIYAMALYADDGATLDDLREAVTTLEEIGRTARHVLGGAHPITEDIEDNLQNMRAALRARHNAELRAAYKEDPSSLSADDRARAEQLLARDARKAAKKAARGVSSETPSPGTA